MITHILTLSYFQPLLHVRLKQKLEHGISNLLAVGMGIVDQHFKLLHGQTQYEYGRVREWNWGYCCEFKG